MEDRRPRCRSKHPRLNTRCVSRDPYHSRCRDDAGHEWYMSQSGYPRKEIPRGR